MATKKPISKSKNAAKKPVKKAPAKKAVKKAAPAKKVVKKAAPAKKAAKKAAPAKKATAKPVKKAAPAKKVVAKAVKKAAPAKKVVAKAVKKTAPAKKVVVKAPVKNIVTKTPAPKPMPAPVAEKKVVVVKPEEIKPTIQKAAVVATPVKIVKENMIEKVKPTVTQRYSDAELQEFKSLIVKKLVDAREELINLQAQIINTNENGTDDTGASFKMLEDGSETLAKEEAANLAARQKKFIEQLEMALIRIENKTYGICRITGKLIAKERLRAVPHTTQSMEAKLKQYRD
jgi:RNA polymerase-binding transcription factor DksA